MHILSSTSTNGNDSSHGHHHSYVRQRQRRRRLVLLALFWITASGWMIWWAGSPGAPFAATTSTFSISDIIHHDHRYDVNAESIHQEILVKLGLNGSVDAILLQDLLSRKHDSDKEEDEATLRARCSRYGWIYDPKRRYNRRRIFVGGMIANDSWQSIAIHATEAYGLYTHVAWVESNRTHTYHPRTMRFVPGSDELDFLQHSRLFGFKTTVTMDYYMVNEKGNFTNPMHTRNGILGQQVHRNVALKRWIAAGMGPDDVGIILDVDEFFTRDVLQALQVCAIPQFDANPHACATPKIIASTLQWEASPLCVRTPDKFRQWHPDAIVGRCLEGIANASHHPVAQRMVQPGNLGWRQSGYMEPYQALQGANQTIHNGIVRYPLWRAVDFRRTSGGNQITSKADKGATGFHVHNFFTSLSHLRHKMATYGEPIHNVQVPLGKINAEIDAMVRCVMDRPSRPDKATVNPFDDPTSTVPIPRAFRNTEYVQARHAQMKAMIAQDEQVYPPAV